jgi:hypothetical protein
MPAKPASSNNADAEIEQLRAEVDRLRALVGPNEQSYIQLKTEIWSARDAVIGAEAENGLLRGQVKSMHAAVAPTLMINQFLKDEVVLRIKRWRTYVRRLVIKVGKKFLR